MDYGSRSLDQFLDDIASTAVTPAGGTAAAVVGATGAALCEMVCLHTLERGECRADAAAELRDARADLQELRTRLMTLGESDASAVDDLLATLPADDATAELKRATGVPLTIAEACLAVVEIGTVVTTHGNENARPDAVTGRLLAHAAMRATAFTARENLTRIDDQSFVADVTARLDEIERAAADQSWPEGATGEW
ncbi:cyclodeaminase/cyclohydrolase family protein [Haloarcula montana]|uniref:cyclodeaminase/cyclohydrolase family protein n=1 Tax=Haloarcula montana TaxID=3111776 RepID=UPI002D7913A8|nr:cyclodeaminase/cyclohydrolase family protein [Haloarcula sp. GH36]